MKSRRAATSAPALDAYEEAAALREALRRFARRSEDVARAHGLTARSYTLLLMIKTGREIPECATPDELEERLQLAKSTVTELLRRNEDSGLIERRLHPHRRGAIIARLTAKGEQKLRDVFLPLGTERSHLLELLDDFGQPS